MSFVLSKILWLILAPLPVLLAMSLGGGYLVLRTRRRRLGFTLSVFGLFILLSLSFLPVGDWLLQPLEDNATRASSQMPQSIDGIILLGGEENPHDFTGNSKDTQPRGASSRYQAFVDLALSYPDARLVFTGGSNALVRENGGRSEADIARDVLTSLNVPQERMSYENASRNTYENAVLTAQLIKPRPEQNWLLVTSAWHMPRALAVFRKAGWRVYPAPAARLSRVFSPVRLRLDIRAQLDKTNYALHEYYGIVAYTLMGRMNFPWSSP